MAKKSSKSKINKNKKNSSDHNLPPNLKPPPPPPPIHIKPISTLLPLPPLIQKIRNQLEVIKIYRKSLKGKGTLESLRKDLPLEPPKDVKMTFYTTRYKHNEYNMYARKWGNSFSGFVNFVLNDYIAKIRKKEGTGAQEVRKPSEVKVTTEDFIVNTQKEKILTSIKRVPTGDNVRKLQNRLDGTIRGALIKNLKEFFRKPTLKKPPEDWRELSDEEIKKSTIYNDDRINDD